jgi:hypothetical protein
MAPFFLVVLPLCLCPQRQRTARPSGGVEETKRADEARREGRVRHVL